MAVFFGYTPMPRTTKCRILKSVLAHQLGAGPERNRTILYRIVRVIYVSGTFKSIWLGSGHCQILYLNTLVGRQVLYLHYLEGKCITWKAGASAAKQQQQTTPLLTGVEELLDPDVADSLPQSGDV